jgi:5-(carboxyamino)imidazole ribonucleotide synthase
MLAPGSTIGIVGGGQLGRMLAMAAARLGFETVVLDPDAQAPAFQVAKEAIIAAYDDKKAIAELAEKSDVITYEFENVPVSALQLVPETTPVHPNTRALEISQDRFMEKSFVRDLGVDTAPFWDCPSPEVLQNALGEAVGRGILKTRRFGYDGKGQIRLSSDDSKSFEAAARLASESSSILEGFVDFEREISVIATRGTDGSIVTYDPSHNVHREGILRTSTDPAGIAPDITRKAVSVAERMLASLDYVGTMGIEFFLMPDSTLLVNEFAPRVHNSGHWTEAACMVSQFENHIRAIAGQPLGNTERHSDCCMENLIGNDMDSVPGLLGEPNIHLHLYGKHEVRPGRKMGHVTRITPKTA